MNTARTLAVGAVALVATACPQEQLDFQSAQLEIIPNPEGTQLILENPPGLDLREVPLFGSATATFTLLNPSLAILRVSGWRFENVANATLGAAISKNGRAVTGDTFELDRDETATLVVTFSPAAHGVIGGGQIVFATNGGRSQNLEYPAQIQGEGRFIGEPNLQVQYDGRVLAVPGDCLSTTGDGYCVLPTLDFGNVPLSSTGETELFLRNAPTAGTCQLPDIGGAPDCTDVCTLTFAPDAAGRNLGIGFEPAGSRFSILGGGTLPFNLVPANFRCNDRGEQRFLVRYSAAPDNQDDAAALVLESNDSDLPRVVIPVAGASRRAPIAVARLRECDAQNPPPNCSVQGAIEPLTRVHFDGQAMGNTASSHDPRDPADIDLIRFYNWSVVRFPAGIDVGMFAPETPQCPHPTESECNTAGAGECRWSLARNQCVQLGHFSFFTPLAGTYTVRLRVVNELGVASGVTPESEVTFDAIPASRFHVQMVWDHPTNDMDLHVVNAQLNNRVFQRQSDCFWLQCHPGCIDRHPNPCEPPNAPVHWYSADPIWEGGNPRLDIDDTNGLGPENFNIDQPRDGAYQIYVHYYGLANPDASPTQVTVRIYLNGTLRDEFRRLLNRNALWAVAQVEYTGGTPVISAAQPDAPNVTGTVRTLNFLPDANGYDFGSVFE